MCLPSLSARSIPLHFQSIDNHHSDPRRRNFYGIWVAPPAVAMIAYSNLTGLDVMDDVQRVLFCELKLWHRVVLLFDEQAPAPVLLGTVCSKGFVGNGTCNTRLQKFFLRRHTLAFRTRVRRCLRGKRPRPVGVLLSERTNQQKKR